MTMTTTIIIIEYTQRPQALHCCYIIQRFIITLITGDELNNYTFITNSRTIVLLLSLYHSVRMQVVETELLCFSV